MWANGFWQVIKTKSEMRGSKTAPTFGIRCKNILIPWPLYVIAKNAFDIADSGQVSLKYHLKKRDLGWHTSNGQLD